MREAVIGLAAVALLTSAAILPVRAAEMAVDLELVLAVDISRSMDVDEQKMQRDGYVAAIGHPDVVSAISQGLHGWIALTYVEWAGPSMQFSVVGWRLIAGAGSARAFAEELARAPLQRYRGTSIANSLEYAAPLFDGNGFDGLRRIIDVSGDGPNNMGNPIEAARQKVVAAGITINGLPIMIKHPGGFAAIGNLDVYYEHCVIGGPGAFLIVVRSPEHFASAIRRKLVLEIAGREPEVIPAAVQKPLRPIDCLIGEKLRQQWLQE